MLECCFSGERVRDREGKRDQALDLLEAQFVFPSALALSPHTGNIMNSSLFVNFFFFFFFLARGCFAAWYCLYFSIQI